MPTEDWMSISVRKCPREEFKLPKGHMLKSVESLLKSGCAVEPPKELVQLDRESDWFREKAYSVGISYREQDWADFVEDMEVRLRRFGIVATQDASSFHGPHAKSQPYTHS